MPLFFVGCVVGPPKPIGPPSPTKDQEARSLVTTPDLTATQPQHTPACKCTPHTGGPEGTPWPDRTPAQP